MKFNILHDPWIEVLGVDGTPRTLGLVETLSESHHLDRLCSDNILDNVATTRLLLAYLHRALHWPADTGQWSALFESGRFDTDKLAGYGERNCGRFELFGATPFLQTPALADTPHKSWPELVADPPDNLMHTRHVSALGSLTCAEAARWLVTTQMFDPAGIKTGAVGDQTVKNGKGYPPAGEQGAAPAGLFTNTMASGQTLFETLMLNLVPWECEADLVSDPDRDLPAWERPVTGVLRDTRTVPDGRVDVFTWQSRRLLLHTAGDRITGATRSYGDVLKVANLHQYEPFTEWRYSKPQTKKAGHTAFMPQLPENVIQQMWRGVEQLTGPGRTVPQRKDEPPAPKAGVVRWLNEAADLEPLDGHRIGVTRTLVIYGNNSSIIEQTWSTDLDVPDVLVGHHRLDLQQAVIDETGSIGTLAWAFGKAVADIAVSRGAGSKDKAVEGLAKSHEERVFAALDTPVRTWIASLNRDSDLFEKVDELRAAARDVLRDLMDTHVATLPPSAWRYKDGSPNPGEIAGRFLRTLHKHTRPTKENQ